MHTHIGYISFFFLHCVFSNVSPNSLSERMYNHFGYICLARRHFVVFFIWTFTLASLKLQDFGKAFPQLSCVFSSFFHQKMLQHIVHMQKAFLQCVVTKWTFKLFQHPPQHPWPPPALPRLPLPIKFLGVANGRVAIVRKNGVADVTKKGVADVAKIGVADVRVAIVPTPSRLSRDRVSCGRCSPLWQLARANCYNPHTVFSAWDNFPLLYLTGFSLELRIWTFKSQFGAIC